MNKLLIFARRFPYGMNEPYLETEMKYLTEFDEVHVFSLSVGKNTSRRTVHEGDNIYYHTIPYQNLIKYILALLTSLFSTHFYKEMHKLFKTKRLNMNAMKQLIIYLAKSKVETKEIETIINEKNIVSEQDKVILYSYRFDYAAYMISKLDLSAKKVIRIARAHGIDLYEYRQSSNYLPFREYILEQIDQLILISKGNMDYAKARYPKYSSKFALSYLGTQHLPFKLTPLTQPLEILSVSSVVSVKRLPLILKAITLASRTNDIHWTHYGAGEGFKELEILVSEQKDNPNLKISLKGHVDNKQMLKEFSEGNFHLFINLSTTEGLPVSIMEAMSVGIPAIATNAGGTYEIVVNDYTGKLINVETTVENVADKIVEISNLSPIDYLEIRENARTHWEENFSADQNYRNFVQQLIQLLK